jgi:hypothetical protein
MTHEYNSVTLGRATNNNNNTTLLHSSILPTAVRRSNILLRIAAVALLIPSPILHHPAIPPSLPPSNPSIQSEFGIRFIIPG